MFLVIDVLSNPPVSIEFGVMATHHITEEMVANKPSFSVTNTFVELPN